MLYDMVTKKRDQWLQTPSCPARGILSYIEKKGALRDAQIDAIRTYLFLKIAGGGRSLPKLFQEGFFNSLDLDALALSTEARRVLRAQPGLAALYEFALLPDSSGKPRAPQTAARIAADPAAFDARGFFRRLFEGRDYAEYLFALPMGAGKTYLMAAFIYLDLYYALLEPQNPVFAHNFIVLAPSGLKSSVVPSLKTIERFDPTWVLPEPSASQVKRHLRFEVLDAPKTMRKSNRTKNPNAAKIALYASQPDCLGLVVVTNAEKVILDRVRPQVEQNLFRDEEDERDRQANELRTLLGNLPQLAVFIDEAHHAAADDIKLRQVVTRWTEKGQSQGGFTQVIGFSGTPYLAKPAKIPLADDLMVKSEEISTIVSDYPLVRGVGNFLKVPRIIGAESGMDSVTIALVGLKEFLQKYKKTVYADGTCAKAAIFCPNIKSLEMLYPEVCAAVRAAGLDPEESVLRFHRGNKEYPAPQGAELAFASLDTKLSKKRVLLLAEIGKEGWDCRSLTCVILAQKGSCPQNKVLQTGCRCLRQVTKGEKETALIYLSDDNRKYFTNQLKKQHHLTIDALEQGGGAREIRLLRYDRTKKLDLPPLHFTQLRIEYKQEIRRGKKNIDAELKKALSPDVYRSAELEEIDMQGILRERSTLDYRSMGTPLQPARFASWLLAIRKESLGTVTCEELLQHEKALRGLFARITEQRQGILCYREDIIGSRVRANIRRAFAVPWHYRTTEEKVPTEARLLAIENFTPEVMTSRPERYYPDQQETERIVRADRGERLLAGKEAEAYEVLQAAGLEAQAAEYRETHGGTVRGSERSYHYLPYHTDSDLEIEFLRDTLLEKLIYEKNLEVYYNGDRHLTEFRVKCYEKRGRDLRYVGLYTPDFLILRRDARGAIARVLIVETKGHLYAGDPNFQKRRNFMEKRFQKLNPHFDYLYLEDAESHASRRRKVLEHIQAFFKE